MSDALVHALMSEVSQLRNEVDQLRADVDKLKNCCGPSSGAGGATSSVQPKPKAAAPSNFGNKFHQWSSQPLSNAPNKFIRPYSTIKDGKVYFNPGKTDDRAPEGFLVYCLDIEKDKWITLPKTTQYFGTLAVVQDMVTYIGGKQQGTGEVTGNLLSFQVSLYMYFRSNNKK